MVQSIVVFVVTTVIGSLAGLIGKSIKDARTRREATRSLLRTEMVKAYYKYRKTKKMPHYIKEAWFYDYAIYKKLHGNSFVDNLKMEIDEWETE